MCFKEWPECYKHCENCDNLRHRDDLILVTDGAVDPDEKMICAQCASKQLSASCQEIKTLKAKLKNANDAFISIAEYWNGSSNDMAVSDALEAMRNMATDAAKAMEEKP